MKSPMSKTPKRAYVVKGVGTVDAIIHTMDLLRKADGTRNEMLQFEVWRDKTKPAQRRSERTGE